MYAANRVRYNAVLTGASRERRDVDGKRVTIGVKDWDRIFDALERTTVVDEIRREVYPDDYADGLKALSMVVLSELRWCADALALAPGDAFLDLGCGLGGPGGWLADATATSATCVDVSLVALRHARAHDAARAPGRARHVVADAGRLPLAGARFRGALAVDVLQCLPDKPAALGELARCLAPGARFAVATRELRAPEARDLPHPIVADHEPLLRAAGFELLRRDEPDGWEPCHRKYYTRLLERREEIAARGGAVLERAAVRDAENVLSMLDVTRRVLLLAQRTASSA